MGVKPTAGMQAGVKAKLAEATKAMEAAIINVLSYLGELCVNHARSLNTYRDQTGNLRASIGYVIVKNGQLVKRNFAGSSQEGKQVGLQLAINLAAELGEGWGLIVVAGMNYALAVESRGLDVLATAEQLAKRELPGLIRQLNNTTQLAA